MNQSKDIDELKELYYNRGENRWADAEVQANSEQIQ